MKRLLSALTLSLTFTACSGPDSDLPEAYRRLDGRGADDTQLEALRDQPQEDQP